MKYAVRKYHAKPPIAYNNYQQKASKIHFSVGARLMKKLVLCSLLVYNSLYKTFSSKFVLRKPKGIAAVVA